MDRALPYRHRYRLAEKLRQPLRAGIAGAFHGAHGQGDGRAACDGLLGQSARPRPARPAEGTDSTAPAPARRPATCQAPASTILLPAGRLLRRPSPRRSAAAGAEARRRAVSSFSFGCSGFDLPGHILRPLVLFLHVAPFRRLLAGQSKAPSIETPRRSSSCRSHSVWPSIRRLKPAVQGMGQHFRRSSGRQCFIRSHVLRSSVPPAPPADGARFCGR